MVLPIENHALIRPSCAFERCSSVNLCMCFLCTAFPKGIEYRRGKTNLNSFIHQIMFSSSKEVLAVRRTQASAICRKKLPSLRTQKEVLVRALFLGCTVTLPTVVNFCKMFREVQCNMIGHSEFIIIINYFHKACILHTCTRTLCLSHCMCLSFLRWTDI